MKTKSIIIPFFIFIIALVIPQNVRAADFSYTYQGQTLYYKIVNGEARVTYQNYSDSYPRYSNLSGTLVIPSNVTYYSAYGSTTYSVTSIDANAFRNCSGLTSVTFPNSVTFIGSNAFWGCSGLTSVTISYSVTSIGTDAFRNCSGLTSVTIPNSVTSIGTRAFYGCSGLTSVIIPNSVTYIQSQTFQGCSGLTSVTIPNSVTSIGSSAFSGCRGLASVFIPNSVTSIYQDAFSGCSGLTSVTLPYSVSAIDQSAFAECDSIHLLTYNCLDNLLGCINKTNLQAVVIGDSVVSISSQLFQNCTNLTSVTIGDSVTSIGNQAFSGCNGLTSVTIPNSVTSIGVGAFAGCNGLTSVTIGNSVTSIGVSAFAGCSGLTSVTIPNSVTSIGVGAFSGCSSLTSVTIGNSVTSIGNQAFSGCSSLTSIVVSNDNTYYDSRNNCNAIVETSTNTLITGCQNTVIPNSVTSIGERAFYNCSVLTSVTIPNSVTSIWNSAFYGCSGLTSVTIPNSVASIGGSAFQGCSGLTSVTIGNSVTSIGGSAFEGCSGLTSVTIPNSVTSIGNQAFYNCSSLTSVAIPNSVTSIGNQAFYNCSDLTSVTIPNSVTSIGYQAFYNCSGLTSVIIGNSVTSIGQYAFRNCIGLSSVTIGNSVTSIGQYAFCDCSGLTSVSIPNSVTYIGNSAFYGCSGLTSVTIGNSVTSIGNNAFDYCSGLTEITSLAVVAPSLGNYAFYNMPDSIPVYIPCGSTASYQQSTWNFFSNFIESSASNIDVQTANSTMGAATIMTHPTCFDSTAVITATANYGYHFTQWNDGNTQNPRTITLTQDTTFTALFDRNQYSVTGVANNSARGTVTGSDTVYYLDTVTLEAIAIDGYYFQKWNDNNTANPRQIVATGNITKTAIFNPNQYSITLSVDTSIHGSCSGGGNYNYLSNRTITATANYGYHFTQWNDGNTQNPRTITLTQDTTFTAMFAKNIYIVTVVSNDNTRGTVAGNDTVEYLDSITISATANYYYHFTRWQDNNTDNPRRVQVTQNKTYTAYFDFNQYSITLDVDTNIHGAVYGGGSYNYLSNRTIIATPNYGYHFTQWSDGDTNNPRVITLTQDTAFTALFAKNMYTIIAIPNDTASGIVTGSTLTEYLDSVTIVAIPNYGYHFTVWSDGDTTNPRTIEATRDSLITAYFNYNQYSIILSVDTNIHGSVAGAGLYNYLSEQTINAIVNHGYHFTTWNDGDTNNPRTITLTQDTAFTALFAKNQYTLTLQSDDVAHGSVIGGGVFDYLDTVAIEATAVEHYHFVLWNDGNRDNPREYVIVDDVTLAAIFAIDTHTVSVTTNDIARGMVEATGSEFSYGTPCTVTATAYTGYVFTRWSNGITANPYTFAVLEDTELIAIFEEEGAQGIDDVDNTDNIRIFSKYDRIHIDGLNGQDVAIYTIDGKTIASLPRATEHVAIPVTTTGVYIVKIGDHPARKVVVIR